jgi:hypothetical protein
MIEMSGTPYVYRPLGSTILSHSDTTNELCHVAVSSDRTRAVHRRSNGSKLMASGKGARSIAMALVAIAIVASTMLSGCGGGPQRSASSYCTTFEDQAVRLRSKYESRLESVKEQSDGFMGLIVAMGTVFEAQGDLVVLFDKLADHAPDEIVSETEAVRDSFKAQIDSGGKAVSDPLGALTSGLVSGLTSMGSMAAVESYIQDNCDLSFMTRSG